MKIILLIILILAVPGCSDNADDGKTGPESEYYELIGSQFTSSGTFTSKQLKVIESQSAFETELAIYSSSAAATINFSTHKLLLIDMGLRSTGGHYISVISVDIFDNHIIANILFVIPGSQCTVSAALTNPYKFIVIPTSKDILFSESIIIDSCP